LISEQPDRRGQSQLLQGGLRCAMDCGVALIKGCEISSG